VRRARFIAAARLEYLAEVIYYSETQAGLGVRFAAAVEDAAARALAFPLSGSPYPSNTRRVLGSLCTDFHSRSCTDRKPKELSSLRSHIMRGVPITGNLAYEPANRRIHADRFAAGHAGRWIRNHMGRDDINFCWSAVCLFWL